MSACRRIHERQFMALRDSAPFTFPDGTSTTVAYTFGGVTQRKAITREIFASPGTVCF
jgi:hypothetical protein